MHALEGMARCHKVRNEWDSMIKRCEEALVLLPEGKKHGDIGLVEERLLILLADAAEAKGNTKLSREYDDKAKKVWSLKPVSTLLFPEIVACYRREAVELLAAGKAFDAMRTLMHVPQLYLDFLGNSGLSLQNVYMLRPLMAALTVLADAATRSGHAEGLKVAQRYRADVEEMEAILAAYWDGILEETRRELAERRGAAAAVGVAAGVDTPGAGAEEEQGRQTEAAEAKGPATEEGG